MLHLSEWGLLMESLRGFKGRESFVSHSGCFLNADFSVHPGAATALPRLVRLFLLPADLALDGDSSASTKNSTLHSSDSTTKAPPKYRCKMSIGGFAREISVS